MNDLHFIKTKTFLSLLMQQMVLQQELLNAQRQLLDQQQELIDSQKKIIRLQDRVAALTPETPDDDKAFWHIASGGMLSKEAARSDDLETVLRFRDWNIEFAKKYIKPYVNPKVYSECLNQMTRGLSERIADLETEREIAAASSPRPARSKKQVATDEPAENRVIQLSLTQDAT